MPYLNFIGQFMKTRKDNVSAPSSASTNCNIHGPDATKMTDNKIETLSSTNINKNEL